MRILTVQGESQATIEIKKSVFICHLKGIEDYDEGLSYVKKVASDYPDARHNCYAFLTRDGRQKFSDNGEPQGTAGVPMTEILKKKEVTDVACVVTRYFGGIKLGTGGLATAYSQAVKEALENAKLIEKAKSIVREIETDYGGYQTVQRLAEAFGAVVLPPEYTQSVRLTFYYPSEKEDEWLEKEKQLFSGKIVSRKKEECFLPYETQR